MRSGPRLLFEQPAELAAIESISLVSSRTVPVKQRSGPLASCSAHGVKNALHRAGK
jgi:hypothetical protein